MNASRLFLGVLLAASLARPAIAGSPSGSPPVPATHTQNGLMSAADKIKIDGLVTPTVSTDLIRLEDLKPSLEGVTATWATGGIRVFAVAPTGSDSNQCWADSPDQTAGNIATATQAAGAQPCATFHGAVSQIPPIGSVRVREIVIQGLGSTYTDSLATFDFRGYSATYIRGTGTSTTAGATAFAGDTADLTFQGFQTCAGMNTSGYNPAAGTGTTQTLTKVGGGSPSFATEPARPLYCRARFDAATATTGLRNKVYSVVAVPSSGSITLDSSITVSSSDVLYLEEAGVVAPGGVFGPDGGVILMSGMKATSGLTFSGQSPILSGVSLTNLTVGGVANNPTNFFTNFFLGSAPIVGPSLLSGFLTVGSGSGVSAATASVGTYGSVSAPNPATLFLGDKNVVGSNMTVGGGGGGSNYSASVQIGGTTSPLRILGTLTFNAARAEVRLVNLPGTTQPYGIVVQGPSDLVFGQGPSGGTKTTAGISLVDAGLSRIWFNSLLMPTLTGAGGDIYWGNYSIVQGCCYSGAVYSSYAGLASSNGGLSSTIFPNGTDILVSIPAASSGDVNTYPLRRAGMVLNEGPATLTPGMLIRYNFTDGSRAVPLGPATSTANLAGGVGVALDTIVPNSAGFAIQDGPSTVQVESGACGGHITTGHNIAYVSATTAGTITCARPAIAKIVGWTTSENLLNLNPDNELEPISSFLVGGTTQNTEPGLNLIFPTGTPTTSDNTGAQRTDLTFPSWLVDPGSNGILVRNSLGATIARTITSSTLGLSNPNGVSGNIDVELPSSVTSIPAPTGTGFAHVTGSAWDGSARAVDLSGADATGTLAAARAPAYTGDVASSAGSLSLAIQPNAVTNADIRQSGPLSVVGRSANSSGNVSDISCVAGGGGVLREASSTVGCGLIQEGAVQNLTTDLAGKQATGNYITALTGDGTASGPGSAAFTLNNIPSGTTMAGFIDGTEVSAPAVGLVGHLRLWGDSSADNLFAITHGGTRLHLMQTVTAVAHQFATATTDAGGLTLAQPAFTDLSGSAACSQLPGLTGDATSTAGTCALTISGLSLSKLGSVGPNVLIANPTGSSATPATLSLGNTAGIVGWVPGSPGILNIYAVPSGQLLFGSGTNGQPTSSSNLTTGLDAQLHVTLLDDTTPSTIAAWDGRHAVFGQAGSTGIGAAFSVTGSTGTVNLSVAKPNNAWEPFLLQAHTFDIYSDAAILGFRQDSTGALYDSTLTSDGLLTTSGGVGKHALATLINATFSSGTFTALGDRKVFVDGADTTADFLDGKILNDSSTMAATVLSPGGNESKRFYVVGVRDGGSLSGVAHKSTGTWANNSVMIVDGSGNWATDSGGAIAAKTTKLFWMILDNVPTSSSAIITSSTAFSSSPTLEYPNDFLAGHVQAKVNFFSSGSAGTFTCFATRNGSGIAGTGLTFSGTLGIQTSTLVVTGSASANDTYGAECSPLAGGGGTINFSYEISLTP